MAEMRLGYGSEFQLLRYLGHHRNYLNKIIKDEIKNDGPIEWLDYPIDLKRDSRDGELCGIDCFKNLSNYKDILKEWKKYWPQRGNSHNWDGIFIQKGKNGRTWYFVEAKAHLEEANQECLAKSEKSIETIINAFKDTCGSETLAKGWQKSKCYQLANRLAFINFCNKVGIKAKLLYISFLNGFDVNSEKNVTEENDWKKKWNEEFECLHLTEELKSNIKRVYIDCHKPEI